MVVSILGCGWVGVTLKKALQSSQIGVNCLKKDIEQNSKLNYYNCNSLVIAIPPSTKEYLQTLETSYNKLHNKKNIQIIFLSSISYYKSKSIILKAEELMKKLHKNVVILRVGGLMGYDRVAGKYSTQKVVKDGYTNYIHQDDVVAIIKELIVQKVENNIFDLVAPIQTTKKRIYTQNAKKFGFKEPIFADTIEPKMALSPDKLCKVLNYTFKKANVLEFWD